MNVSTTRQFGAILMSRPRSKKIHYVEQSVVELNPKQNRQKFKNVVLRPRGENQEKYVAELENDQNDIVFAVGPAGTGKAQPLTAKIKVPGGWTTMGEIKIGTVVSTPDGKTANVTGIFPQGVKETFIVELKDGRKTECCGEHLWEVFYDDNWGGKPRVMSTVDMIAFQEKNRKPLMIRLPEHEETADIELPIDPYLLGAILGDGSVFRYGFIGFTTADSFMLEKLNEICKDDGYFTYLSGVYNYQYKPTARKTGLKKGEFSCKLKEEINKLELFGTNSHTKFIPEVYLHASKNQKIKLLQGLLDTDGYAATTNSLEFTTTSKQLCDAVAYLVRSIGGAAKISSHVPSCMYKGERSIGKLAYNVGITYKYLTDLVSLPRKKERLSDMSQYSKKGRLAVKSITPSGEKECQCIMIDSQEHLYITDDFIVTHNTKIAVEYAIQQLQSGKIQKIIITRPAVSVDEEHGFLPGTLEEKMAPWVLPIIDYFEEYYHPKDVERMIEEKVIEIAPLAYMRGRTFKDSIIIFDEAQLATVSQTKMALTRLGQNSRLLVTGDLNQADRGADNGLNDFIVRLEQVKSSHIAFIQFTHKDIKRHRVVQDVLRIYGDED